MQLLSNKTYIPLCRLYSQAISHLIDIEPIFSTDILQKSV